MLLYMTFHSASEATTSCSPSVYAMTGGVILQWLLGYNFSVAVSVGYIASMAWPSRLASSWSCTRARLDGVTDGCGGAVAVIQRFGGALDLNLHSHLLVWTECSRGPVPTL